LIRLKCIYQIETIHVYIGAFARSTALESSVKQKHPNT
jgi:hypothetical protein